MKREYRCKSGTVSAAVSSEKGFDKSHWECKIIREGVRIEQVRRPAFKHNPKGFRKKSP